MRSNEVDGISMGRIAGRALGFTNYQQLYSLKVLLRMCSDDGSELGV